MPDRETPEPPHIARRPATTGGGTGRDHPIPADLSAVPKFLRDRGAAQVRLPRRSVGRADPEPDPGASAAAAVAALPMAGLPPRRLIVLGLVIALAWMAVSFGRQVTEASAATARADQLRAATAALAVEVAGLERELQTVQDVRYITGAARAYRLGTVREIAFALEVGAPPLAPDAPGSGSLRLGAEGAPGSPLESWLTILFGPGG